MPLNVKLESRICKKEFSFFWCLLCTFVLILRGHFLLDRNFSNIERTNSTDLHWPTSDFNLAVVNMVTFKYIHMYKISVFDYWLKIRCKNINACSKTKHSITFIIYCVRVVCWNTKTLNARFMKKWTITNYDFQ